MKYPKDAKKIKEVCDYLHITSYTLSKNLGYKSPSSIYHVEKGMNQLTTSMANKIIKTYPQFDFHYLIGEEGDNIELIADEDSRQIRENVLLAASDSVNVRLEFTAIKEDIEDLRVQISDMQDDIREVLKIISKQ